MKIKIWSGIIIAIVLLVLFFMQNDQTLVPDLVGKSVFELDNKDFMVNFVDSSKPNGEILNQSIAPGEPFNSSLTLEVSNGLLDFSLFREHQVNELGRIPILMYHGIYNMKNSETEYTGGNVDQDGYHRTAEAFRNDLQFFYENDYQMIRLEDYLLGVIDVEIGKSPLILTFDDGLANNFKVIEKENDELVVDENSAIGILESFREKHPDFQVTATFFLNGPLFRQVEYNYDIIEWLIENNYDVGNHSYGHRDLSKLTKEQVQTEIGRMDQLLVEITDNQNVKVVSLPFGQPYSKEHENFPFILKGKYEQHNYENIGTLRVGWDADFSPYSKNFDVEFVRRVRAYDNDGQEFDLQDVFSRLETTRYVSSGFKNAVVVPKELADQVVTDKRIILYE